MAAIMRDLIVVLPGITGSTLAKDGKLVWAPSAGAVLRAIRTLGRSIQQLRLPDGIGDGHPDDGVEPVAVMPDLHLLPGVWSANIGYGALLDWLRRRFQLRDQQEAPHDDPDACANLLPIAYDWRLSNRFNGRRLKGIVEPALEKWRRHPDGFRDAKVIFLCHSMGGLVARWYVDVEGGGAITRKLITLGTPHRGALNALDALVNGVCRRLGPLAIDVTAFARSLPSLYQLLPEYACIENGDALAKLTETDLPLPAALLQDGMRFHQQLDEAWTGGGYDLHPIVGFRQPTSTTARLRCGRVEPIPTIGGEDEGGDGTVPRLSATPKKLRPSDPSVRGAAERHGSLQSNQAILDELQFTLEGRDEVYKAAARCELSVAVDELVLAGEPLAIEARMEGDERLALRASVRDESGSEVDSVMLSGHGAALRGEVHGLPPGGYVVEVGGVGREQRVAPVRCPLVVWEGAGG